MELFYGGADGALRQADQGWLNGLAPVVARVQPRPVAPAGLGRLASLGPLWCVVRHDGACRLTLTPIIDGVARTELTATQDFDAIDEGLAFLDEVVKLVLSVPMQWPGQPTPFSQQAVKGVFATVRATLTPRGTPATVTLLDLLVITAAHDGTPSNDIAIELVDPADTDQALEILVVGLAITVNLATGPAGAITTTVDQLIAALAANEDAAALATGSRADGADGSELLGADGDGLAGGVDPVGELFALAAFEIAQAAGGVSGTSIPVAS